MNKSLLLLFLFSAATASAGAAKPPTPDPLARLWEVERIADGLSMMSIDIPHGDPADPVFLSIYVSVDTAAKKVADIALIVPAAADKPKGLAIGFVKVGKKIEVPAALARLIPLSDKDDVGYLIRIPAGVIPAQGDAKPLALLDCFMQNQLVTFIYYVGGKEMRASTTLSGFQSQYRDLHKKPQK
jgi:hypothetical protein